MGDATVSRTGEVRKTTTIEGIDILWITAGLGCDGDPIAMTAATHPSIEDIVTGALPWIPKVKLYNPFWTTKMETSSSGPSAPRLGLHIMGYRAGMIGRSLDVRREQSRGTAVTCRFPIAPTTKS